ncbi:hypothetical protein [Sciscionella marina]|uniref:hypothetical protein n=1 Tax=Sciscionella marina TaxID=508770 RepID=UPI00036694EE|nr:hypothetical protein [Sciscionella marina]
MDLVGTGTTVIPQELRGLLDDAALFPPGELPLTEAVPAHHTHRAADYAALLGPFVFPAPRLAELPAQLGGRPIALSLTVPEGPAAVAAAVREATAIEGVTVAVVEVGFPDGARVSQLEPPPGGPVFLEVPRDDRRPAILDAVAESGHRAKFRTGGGTAQAYPDELELAAAITGCVARGLAFKCTAGLHHAVRNTEGSLEQHGFLNVLLATGAALDGAVTAELAALLADRDGDRLAERWHALGAAGRDRVRSRMLSLGTCSITEPLADLRALGVLDHRPEGTS